MLVLFLLLLFYSACCSIFITLFSSISFSKVASKIATCDYMQTISKETQWAKEKEYVGVAQSISFTTQTHTHSQRIFLKFRLCLCPFTRFPLFLAIIWYDCMHSFIRFERVACYQCMRVVFGCLYIEKNHDDLYTCSAYNTI